MNEECKYQRCAADITTKAITLVETYLAPLVLLAISTYIFQIFFLSGLTKIDNWETTLFLFKEEYAVPYIPYDLAACLATIVELAAPVLLIAGFMGRKMAGILLIMTTVIEFTYQSIDQHIYWALLLGVLIVAGPGKLSIDSYVREALNKGAEVGKTLGSAISQLILFVILFTGYFYASDLHSVTFDYFEHSFWILFAALAVFHIARRSIVNKA